MAAWAGTTGAEGQGRADSLRAGVQAERAGLAPTSRANASSMLTVQQQRAAAVQAGRTGAVPWHVGPPRGVLAGALPLHIPCPTHPKKTTRTTHVEQTAARPIPSSQARTTPQRTVRRPDHRASVAHVVGTCRPGAGGRNAGREHACVTAGASTPRGCVDAPTRHCSRRTFVHQRVSVLCKSHWDGPFPIHARACNAPPAQGHMNMHGVRPATSVGACQDPSAPARACACAFVRVGVRVPCRPSTDTGGAMAHPRQ